MSVKSYFFYLFLTAMKTTEDHLHHAEEKVTILGSWLVDRGSLSNKRAADEAVRVLCTCQRYKIM